MLKAQIMNSIVLATLCVGGALADEGKKPEKPSGYVSIILSSASFDPKVEGIRCKVKMVNDTGRDLIVHSGYDHPEVYDSMEFVITDKDGIVQHQQYYGHHKNPTFSNKPKEVKLSRGSTEKLIFFPYVDAGSLPSIIKVRLVGSLPGSGYSYLCSSESVEITLVPPEK